DRRHTRHPPLAVPGRRHAGKPDRRAVPGRSVESAHRLARLPRGDPARDLARRESGGAADRAPLRVPADGRVVSAAATTGLLTPGARLRRRKLVNRAMGGVGTLAPLAAGGVLGLCVYSVAS